MKIFLIGWSTDILIGVAKELKRRGIDIAYWSLNWEVPATGQIDKKDFPGTIFHHSLEAIRARAAPGIEVGELEPIGQDLVSQLARCESETLTMMNRVDYTSVPFWKRKRFYYQYLKYWSGVLKKLRPEAIIFSTTPHMVYDFVLYHLARHLKIKTLMFNLTSIPDRLILQDNIEEGSKALLKELASNQQDVPLEGLAKDLRDYFSRMSDKEKTYLFYHPSYHTRAKKHVYIPYKPELKSMVQKLKKGNLLGILKSIKDYLKKTIKVFSQCSSLTSFDDDFTGLRYVMEVRAWERLKKQFRKEYQALQTEPDFDKTFILVALAAQPERSTSPMGGVFCDQLLTVDILSKAVPRDWLLYVKEHPAQWSKGGVHFHQGRHRGYYQAMAELPNVRLVPVGVPIEKLILNSRAVAVISGTTGWQALFKSKPVLLFGCPVYQYCDGIFKISNLADCQAALKKIAAGFQPDRQKVLNFLAALDRVSVRGYLSFKGLKDSTTSAKDCIKNLSEAINKELK